MSEQKTLGTLGGRWRLEQSLCTPQKPLLKAMGRPFWQIMVIDQADEDFFLLHFVREIQGHTLHYFDKKVKIYLSGGIVRKLTSLMKLEFDKVNYQHRLSANRKPKHHPNDEKQFGDCTSVTSWDHTNGKDGFTIQWQLKTGVLKVFHCVNSRDQLECHMEFEQPNGKKTHAIKRYVRVPLTAEDRAYIDAHTEKSHLSDPQ